VAQVQTLLVEGECVEDLLVPLNVIQHVHLGRLIVPRHQLLHAASNLKQGNPSRGRLILREIAAGVEGVRFKVDVRELASSSLKSSLCLDETSAEEGELCGRQVAHVVVVSGEVDEAIALMRRSGGVVISNVNRNLK
jgi:hypothetical protein